MSLADRMTRVRRARVGGAEAVVRALRAAGIPVEPARGTFAREGVYVGRRTGKAADVVVHVDDADRRHALVEAVSSAMRAAGYTIRAHDRYDAILYVTRP